MNRVALGQALAFVAVSGGGWLVDVSVFMGLTALVAWLPLYANIVSSSCGVLFVFVVSSRRIFERNAGSMLQKVALLILFNLLVIVVCSFVLAAIVTGLSRLAFGTGLMLPPAAIGLAAKVIVTPMTLVLNFLVVRFLLERFVGLLASPPPSSEVVR